MKSAIRRLATHPQHLFLLESVYMPEFGVRSEVNVLVRGASAEVTGRVQTELVVI